jgi:PAS domain S-box-containing protein
MQFDCDGIKNQVHQRYEVLLQLAPFGFLLVDLSGEITEVNQTALKILGSPSAEETRQINMLSYPPLEDAGISQMIRDAIGSQKPVQKVIGYTSKWGKTSTMRCTACSIIDSTGQACFIAFIFEDVTELEEMRDKYYRASRTLASVVDAVPHYIWAKDELGVYHVVSKSYADLFDCSPLNMVGKTDYDLYPHDMAEQFRADDLEVLTSCGYVEKEETVQTPRLGTRHWRTIKSAICDESGAGVLTVGIAEDVTEEHLRRQTAIQAMKQLEAFIQRNNRLQGEEKECY